MSSPTHSFQNETIKVSFDGSICAHAGICFGELHSVFDGADNELAATNKFLSMIIN